MNTAPNQNNMTQAETTMQKKQAIGMLIVAVVITLFTYQVFHHGLRGKLQSLGKAPKLVLTGTIITPSTLKLAVYNTNGPGTYGEFTTKVLVTVPGQAAPAEQWNAAQLATVPNRHIHNYYPFQEITQGPNGLVVPLAAKGIIDLPLNAHAVRMLSHSHEATVSVEDVSGLTWRVNVLMK